MSLKNLADKAKKALGKGPKETAESPKDVATGKDEPGAPEQPAQPRADADEGQGAGS